MQKIVVFGLGSTYIAYKDYIYSNYEVIGVTDNGFNEENCEGNYIPPNSLPKDEIKILISIRKKYLDVFRQLIDYGIDHKNIINIEDIISKEVIEGWKKGGHELPPPAEYKHRVVQEYSILYGCRKLIETGTFYGGMIEAQLTFFNCIASVELSNELFCKAVKKFEGIGFVNLYCGDSGQLIGRIIDDVGAGGDSAVFWLDGHYSGGETARAENDTPIIEELYTISQKCQSGVVLIDDARCFIGVNGYPTIEQLEEYVREHFRIKSWENYEDIIRFVF